MSIKPGDFICQHAETISDVRGTANVESGLVVLELVHDASAQRSTVLRMSGRVASLLIDHIRGPLDQLREVR